MNIARTAAQALVAGGTLVTVAGLLGPATWRQGEAHGKPAFVVMFTVLLLGPALSALCAAATRLRPGRGAAAVTGGAALLSAVLAGVGAAGEATLDGLAPGGPLTALGGVLSAVGWLVAALTHRAQGPVRWRPLACAVLLVLLLGWLGPAAVARGAAAGVEYVPVPPVPVGSPAAPAGLDSRWEATVPGRVVGLAGGVLLVADRAGVRTVDARTGRPAWRYLRPGWSLAGVGPAAGGHVVVGVWRHDGGPAKSAFEATAFEATTGVRRWQRELPTGSTVDYQVTGAADQVVLTPRGKPAAVRALSVLTGRPRWTWRPANPACVPQQAAGAARVDVVAVAFGCPDGRRVAGVSTVDGKVGWTWAPSAPDGSASDGSVPPHGPAPGGPVPDGYLPPLVPTDGGVLVTDGPTGLVLSLTTGTPGGRHPAGGRLVASSGSTALYAGRDGAVGVDLALGRERWRAPLPAATSPVAVAAAGDAGFVLVVPDRGGPATVLRFALDTGAVVAETRTDDAAVGLTAGPGVLMVHRSTAHVRGLS